MAASKNTKQTMQTWLTVWMKWCEVRSIDIKIESFSPQALDKILTKFFIEVRKRDCSKYEPDSPRVMQKSIDGYLRQKNHPVSIVSGWELKSQETEFKREKDPTELSLTKVDKEIFWTEGKLGNHNGVALTNINFKNLSEHMGFRGHQDHYDA